MKTIDIKKIRQLGKDRLILATATMLGKKKPLKVTYHTKEYLDQKYKRYLEVLEMKPMMSEIFIKKAKDPDASEALLDRLDKIKLWNFAPQKRDEIKEAREFVKNCITTDIPYGQTIYIENDDIDGFLDKSNNLFGVKSYEYQTKNIPNINKIASIYSNEAKDQIKEPIDKFINIIKKPWQESADIDISELNLASA